MSQTVREIAERHIYVASRASVPARPEMWKRMRAVGWPIISSWIDEAGPGETASMRELWAKIHAEISACSLLVMYAEPSDLPLKGAYVEAGIALALGKPVIVVSTCDVGSWANHPQVKVVREMPSLPEALEACDRYLAAHVLASTETLGDDLAARNLILRKHIHAIEGHNQYFERCESAWCNPNPPLAAAGGFSYDPASMPHGDRFVFKQDALIADLRAQLQAAVQEEQRLNDLFDKAHADATIAHRFIESLVGEQARGRDFAVKVPMAEKLIDRQHNWQQLADERGQEVERVKGFVRQIFGPKYDSELASMGTPAATPPTKSSFRQTLRAHGIPLLSEERQAENLRAEFGIDPMPPEQELCGDCPPIGYPNDSTRCIPCPRRPAATPSAQPLGQRLRQISDAALASGTPTLSADEIQARLNDPPAHAYTSTACQHGLHDRCRKNCKFCGVACACSCHATVAMPPASATKEESK